MIISAVVIIILFLLSYPSSFYFSPLDDGAVNITYLHLRHHWLVIDHQKLVVMLDCHQVSRQIVPSSGRSSFRFVIMSFVILFCHISFPPLDDGTVVLLSSFRFVIILFSSAAFKLRRIILLFSPR